MSEKLYISAKGNGMFARVDLSSTGLTGNNSGCLTTLTISTPGGQGVTVKNNEDGGVSVTLDGDLEMLEFVGSIIALGKQLKRKGYTKCESYNLLHPEDVEDMALEYITEHGVNGLAFARALETEVLRLNKRSTIEGE